MMQMAVIDKSLLIVRKKGRREMNMHKTMPVSRDPAGVRGALDHVTLAELRRCILQEQSAAPLGFTVVEYALLCVMLVHRIKGVRTSAANVGGLFDKGVDLDRPVARLIHKGYVRQVNAGYGSWRPTQFGMLQLIAHLCEMPDCPSNLKSIPRDEMGAVLAEAIRTAT